MRPSAYGVAHPRIPLANVPGPVTACTANAVAPCAEPPLHDVPSFFELGIRTVGAIEQPALPEGVFNPMICAGGTWVPPAIVHLKPLARGTITHVDASAWERFETGNACVITSDVTNMPGVPSTVAPEPATSALLAGGLVVDVALADV